MHFRSCSIIRGREMFANCKTPSNTRWCWRRQGVIGVKELPAEIQLPPALQQAELGGLPRKGVQTLDDLERNAILQALAECRGNKKKAAELLGIQRPTLYNKLKRYAIEL